MISTLRHFPTIRFIRPLIPPPEAWTGYLHPAYQAQHFSNFGPVNALFEIRMAESFSPGRRAITTSNCTSGLVAALHALRVTGKVVIPSFTFAATIHAVLQAGCTPIFCDIDPVTLHLCPEALSRLLQRHDVGAIMPVRALGLWDPLTDISAIARKAGIQLIVDAAPALGLNALSAQASNHVEIVSLHATKTFAIGEGGVIFAPPHLEEAIRRSTNFGLLNGEVQSVGSNAKLSEFQAAIGLSVLDAFTELMLHRRRIAERYVLELQCKSSIERVWIPSVISCTTFPLLLRPGVDTEMVIRVAASKGVEIRNYYRPLHTMPPLRSYASELLPHTNNISPRILCLPVYSDMREIEQDQILSALDTVLH